MQTDDAISGTTNGVGLSNIVNDISTQLSTLRTNLINKLNAAGIDTSGINTIGDLASVIKQQGYPAVARLLAAILLARALVVREFGRYTGGNEFAEVLSNEFSGFANVPSTNDLDNILQAVEAGGTSSGTTLTKIARKIESEAIEELTEEPEEKEEEKE